MTCLVTGGAGFIGSHLCECLLREGNSVVCIDNFVTGEKENVERLLTESRFTFIEHDIIKRLEHSQVSRADCIFHLASPASPNKRSEKSYMNHPIETLLVNSLGTYHLLERVKHWNAKFLYASSSEVYGDPQVSPQKEDYLGNVNPVGPRSMYDEGKRFGEAITMAYVRTFRVDARIVRIFNTYGERMQNDDGRVVSNFINQAVSNKPLTVYGDGSQTRSFCYISDMIEGIIKTMESQRTCGEVINLGNPTELKIIDLAHMIKRLTDSRSSIVFEEKPADDPRRRKPDIEKAKKLLGWEPKVPIEEGLKRTIEYVKRV